MSSLINFYQKIDINFTQGDGCYIWDDAGNKYLDMTSGVGVNNLGHKNDEINREINQQIEHYIHLSNLFTHQWSKKLSDKLVEISNLNAAFFCNSGTEANETAIKIAKLYAHENKIKDPKIIVMKHAFHGRTIGALSATGNNKYKQQFGKLLDDFIFVDFNDIDDLQAKLEQHHVCAVMLEPIQGEAGVNISSTLYLKQLRKLCHQYQCLLIFDEVQCGLGRTGYWFYHQKAEIIPDVLTLAKGLANGLPIGACLVSEELNNLLKPGMHGSTFGGNPLVCRVAYKVLEIIERDQFVQKNREKGEYFINKLQSKFTSVRGIKSIRGMGLMIAIELDEEVFNISEKMLINHKILINVTQNKIIRLLPSFFISEYDINYFCENLYCFMKNNLNL
ncbi:aspartate aminotransferase family protein [Acinetobacter rongchengensis]|uniref:Aspartate aminotransferase family protein n=1 Tax=Acinetobacter rongchengensis TaxID=2419601 RepID=A0A3A8ERD6_9GAMM|nr:aspartate aminotransferase family protein [Acinetobacter rongchengensis]RKG37452.1 aspartate aminotransferase family protein [Acinetobacter rongchengensis]